MAHGLSRLKVLFVLPTLLFGKHTGIKGIELFDCKTLDITLDKPASIHFDGEAPGEINHINLSCTSKQLRIIK